MRTAPSIPSDELLFASRPAGPGLRQNELSVPAIHCGACVARIERLLGALPRVERARVNLSTRRVSVAWRGEAPPPLIEVLGEAGFEAHLHEPVVTGDPVMKELVRALAVAAFAGGNIMMLSVGVWSGADPGTRDLFHWISACIALPALAYSGRIFFRSAWQALRHGRTNMDVPISVGVLLAFALSLYETAHHGPHAYFDAAVCLLFFLLGGRTLDHVMRERARAAVCGLQRLAARGALVVSSDGTTRWLPLGDIRPGMEFQLAAGDRVPVDARVSSGRSEIDTALVTGESVPRAVAAGDRLQAGMLNLSGSLRIEAVASADGSFLAEMTRLMEAAEAGRSSYRLIADRAAALYTPVIHIVALATFIGWLLLDGSIHAAATASIAALIITCPCALGLAVPMVQVVAARRLFEAGIMIKDGGALERLAEADHVVFDKTGTLTRGVPMLADTHAADARSLEIATGLASRSRHPYALAIAGQGHVAAEIGEVREIPGCGLEATIGDDVWRLGRPDWALRGDGDMGQVVLTRDGLWQADFSFDDALQPDAARAVAVLEAAGFPVEIVSGDSERAVGQVAAALGVTGRAGVPPAGKVARISELVVQGRKVLMVGDGLNDAAALATAHVSMATASAADLGRNAADIVLLRDSLAGVPEAIEVARRARALVRQNFVLAIAYNSLALPLAVLGLVTPLLAAIAMSASSILVVANALRLLRSAKGAPVAASPTARADALAVAGARG